MTATTALTAQNTIGVNDVHITPPAFVGKQIDAVLNDVGLGDDGVVKMGEWGLFFLWNEGGTVEVLADAEKACWLVQRRLMLSREGYSIGR